MTGTPSSPSASMVSRYSSTGGWYSCGMWAPCSAMAVIPVRGRGHIEGRVAVEEPDGDEREARALDRHDGPVLGAWDVRDPEGVPQHDVGVDDGAILRRPRRESGPARVLVGVVAGRSPLLG